MLCSTSVKLAVKRPNLQQNATGTEGCGLSDHVQANRRCTKGGFRTEISTCKKSLLPQTQKQHFSMRQFMRSR